MTTQFHPARTFRRLLTANRAYQVLKSRAQKWGACSDAPQAGPAVLVCEGRNSGQAVSFAFPKRVAVQIQHRESLGVRIRFGGGQAHSEFGCNNDNPDRIVSLPAPSLRAGYLATSLRRIPLVARSRPFLSIVINSLRGLASVLLLRQSQPPRLSRNEKPRLISSSFRYSALKPCKQSRRSFPNRFRTSLRLIALVHDKDDSEGALKCTPKGFPISEKEFLRMQ